MLKKCTLLIGIITLLMACGLDKQAKELRALENCRYEFVSADSIFLAGTDVGRLIAGGRLDVGSLPGVALGFLNRDVPLSGLLQVRVTNPTRSRAGIQQFAYKILIEDREVMDGTSDLPVIIPAGETVIVPVKLQANVYSFLSDRQTQGKLLTFLKKVQNGQSDEKIKVSLKIKPTLALGNKQLNYPGYITVDKEVDGRMLTGKQVL
ncbi:LEA type 2 family protein [Parapedobacter lycopersici]|uniref:LEA type 2 family protein n=1 Tax=Parapedobacter lycopersici TaxID=1864939 RepID=UPI00333FEBF8